MSGGHQTLIELDTLGRELTEEEKIQHVLKFSKNGDFTKPRNDSVYRHRLQLYNYFLANCRDSSKMRQFLSNLKTNQLGFAQKLSTYWNVWPAEELNIFIHNYLSVCERYGQKPVTGSVWSITQALFYRYRFFDSQMNFNKSLIQENDFQIIKSLTKISRYYKNRHYGTYLIPSLLLHVDFSRAKVLLVIEGLLDIKNHLHSSGKGPFPLSAIQWIELVCISVSTQVSGYRKDLYVNVLKLFEDSERDPYYHVQNLIWAIQELKKERGMQEHANNAGIRILTLVMIEKLRQISLLGEDSIASFAELKEQLFDAIQYASRFDPEMAADILSEVLDKETILGQIFWTPKKWDFQSPSLKKGTLLKAKRLLDKINGVEVEPSGILSIFSSFFTGGPAPAASSSPKSPAQDPAPDASSSPKSPAQDPAPAASSSPKSPAQDPAPDASSSSKSPASDPAPAACKKS